MGTRMRTTSRVGSGRRQKRAREKITPAGRTRTRGAQRAGTVRVRGRG